MDKRIDSICGTPTCCIAFQQHTVTHISEQSLDEFQQHAQSNGLSITGFIGKAVADNSLFSQMNLNPVTDFDEAKAKVDSLMSEVQ